MSILNDKPCLVRPILIDMNLNELNYYTFMINLNKRTVWKDINVKAFNMITNKDEAKAMTEQISCDCKCRLNSTICNSNRKWNNKTCQCECKNYHMCEKDYSLNRMTCICESSKYLKSVADTPVTACDEIVVVTNNLSTKRQMLQVLLQ